MSNCPICGKQITNEEPLFLFFSEKKNEPVYCCDVCEKQMDVLLKTQEPSALKKAINYFYTYADEVDDREVKEHLQQIIDSNAEVMEELSAKKEKQKPISERQKDYFSDKAKSDSDTSFWISAMRFFAYVGMIAIFIAGIAMSIPLFETKGMGGIGFMVIVISIIISVISTGGIMIFLDMAEHLKYIRNRLPKK